MKPITPYTARRRKGRLAWQISRRLEKVMNRFPDCEWVLGYRYLGATSTTSAHEWHSVGSDRALVSKFLSMSGSYDQALMQDAPGGGAPHRKPMNSTLRASMCRGMLKAAWLEHVRGTPWEGKTQMYNLVRGGECPGFPWWASVVGDDVEFSNVAVNNPDVSSKLWDYLSREDYRKKNVVKQY